MTRNFLLVMTFLATPTVWASELPAEAKAVLQETSSVTVASTEALVPLADVVKLDTAKTDSVKVEAKSEKSEPLKVESAKANVDASAKALADGSQKLAESEIPLALESKKAASSEGGLWMRVIFGLGVAVLLLAGAWFFRRRMAKPGQRKSGPQIKVLNQHWLGPKKSLAVIHIAGESILVGITDHNISLIKSLSLIDDEVPAEVNAPFAKTLEGMTIQNSTAEDETEAEEFTMSGLGQVKEMVGRRLRNMRTLG